MTHSLLMINTGLGKGKTTAALGLALRMAGHNRRVCLIQFIKSNRGAGEITSLKRFGDLIDIHVTGRGFTWQSDDMKKDTDMAINGWELAKSAISSEKYQLVILDEFTYLMFYDMIDTAEVIKFLTNRPKTVHVMITGRNAPPELMGAADLVTEMRAIKHHARSGAKAQIGIEF